MENKKTIDSIIKSLVEKGASREEIDELITLSKESLIKPIEVCINEDEVIKRYPVTESMEIVRCNTAIFFHTTCFWVVSKPTLANSLKGGALFEMLSWYCDYMDERDSYSDEDKERFDTLSAMIVNILSLPLDVFTDMNFMLDIAVDILDKRNEYYTRVTKEASVEKPETLEDALDNAAFEAEVLAQEQLAREISAVSKKKHENNKRPS